MKRALITGISGQDGSYLSEYLISLGYEVYGIVRRHSVAENQNYRLHHINGKVETFYGDLLDVPSLTRIVSEVKPDEIYNLAAMSHVRISFDIPSFTIQTNALGVLNLLEVYRSLCPEAKFYQASSSEMFGNSVDPDGVQRLTTPMNPVSPYGCAKVLAYNLVRHYRHAYGLHACNGILFNHESPRRGINFVTNKVVIGAVKIKKGLQQDLVLGNLDSTRDWGHAKDYVKVMWQMLQLDKPDDFVCATGVSHSVRELCIYVFNSLGMNYEDYVKQDSKFFRPAELHDLKGCTNKLQSAIDLKFEYTFEQMIDEMVKYWMEKF